MAIITKGDLADFVADKSGLTKKDSASAVNAVLDVVAEALREGDEVRLTGFGSFSVKERAAREGRNPATGKTITIAASKSAHFKAGKGLKDTLNG